MPLLPPTPGLVPPVPALLGWSPLPMFETPPHAPNRTRLVPKLASVPHRKTFVAFIGNPSFLQTVIPDAGPERSRKKQFASARGVRAFGKTVQQALGRSARFALSPHAIAGLELQEQDLGQ
jgi:hypothetical protein